METFQSVWYHTQLPADMVDIIQKDIKSSQIDSITSQATVGTNVNDGLGEVNQTRRDSKVAFTAPFNWLTSFCQSYINEANQRNFRYDINAFEFNQMQYTEYGDGQFYNWHTDEDLSLPKERIRKLSFTLQLSDPDEYEGGEFQLLSFSNKMYAAPKERGTIIIFDSRSMHRVTRVKSGLRKSLVGWVEGPRWR